MQLTDFVFTSMLPEEPSKSHCTLHAAERLCVHKLAPRGAEAKGGAHECWRVAHMLRLRTEQRCEANHQGAIKAGL